MTVVNPIAGDASSTVVRQRRLVRWSSAVTTWTDRFGACSHGGRRHGRVSLVVAVEPIEPGRAAIEAWMELPERRQGLLERRCVPCESTFDGRMLHLDAMLGEDRLLALSLDVCGDRLLFAQTTLLARFAAGAFDPPTLAQPAPELPPPGG